MNDEINFQPSDGQSIDTTCKILRDARRRYALSALSDRESPVALTDLARDVAAYERETDRDDVSAETVESVAVSLHHNHLPMLADANLVTYDPRARTVDPDGIGALDELLPPAEN